MSDLIDRQEAIELIERMKPYHQDADDIAEMIANMPSAQPEWAMDVEEILEYLDIVVHPLLSPEYYNVYSLLHDMVSGLPKQPGVDLC